MLDLFPSLLLSAADHSAVTPYSATLTAARTWSTGAVLGRALYFRYLPVFIGALICVLVGLWSVRPATHRKIVGAALLAAAVAALGLAAMLGFARFMQGFSIDAEPIPRLPLWNSTLGNACVVGELLLAGLLGRVGLQEWRRGGGTRAPLAVIGLTVAIWVGWAGYDDDGGLSSLLPINLMWASFVTLVLLQLWGRRREREGQGARGAQRPASAVR